MNFIEYLKAKHKYVKNYMKNYSYKEHKEKEQGVFSELYNWIVLLILVVVCHTFFDIDSITVLLIYMVMFLNDLQERLTYIYNNTKAYKPYKNTNTEEVSFGSYYEHYKGGIYYVIGVSRHTETEEILVLYRKVKDVVNHESRREIIFDEELWARPIGMWNELVDDKMRFTLIPSIDSLKIEEIKEII